MKKRENRLPRDRQILVDLLNFDFQQKPSRWLDWFFGRYPTLSYEMAKQIQGELRAILFLHDPSGNRELGPLVAVVQDNKYYVKFTLLAGENNKKPEYVREMPTEAREHLYQTIIEAVDDESFSFLQPSCKNCGRYYWHRGDYCNLKCGREFNRKGSAERMRRLRRKRKRGK
jgi:hypothetical protein